MEKDKLTLAIVGQGRSGKNIHGAFYRSERNVHFNPKYVVDADPVLRAKAEELYPGCVTMSDYRELFDRKDIDIVVNSTYSNEHATITADLLRHGFNVLTEKPMGATYTECMTLDRLAKENGVRLFVFHNTQKAPFYLHALKLMHDGTLGEPRQVSIRYNALSRRWDWQTLQKKLAGSAYNTGPHPFAMALGFLGDDPGVRVAYSKLDRSLTFGDADDYVKAILTAPSGLTVDVEISSTDAFSDYTLKVQGSRGTLCSTPKAYKLKYIVEGENPPREVVEGSLRDADGMPVYCKEKLITHEESGEYEGTAFDIGTSGIYEDVYLALTEGREPEVSNEFAARVTGIIERIHADNPLSVEFV